MACCVEDVCKLVVVSQGKTRSAEIETDVAFTVIACLSDDPAGWAELLTYWPRYRTPVVPIDLFNLKFLEADSSASSSIVAIDEEHWLVVDLDQKRLVTSTSLSFSQRDCVFDLFSDQSPDKRWPLSIHLPPWWEIKSEATEEMFRARSTPLVLPKTNRELLMGESLIEFLSEQMLNRTLGSSKLRELLKTRDLRSLHQWTVEIHRDWLMTPHERLHGGIPRQLLHGAHEWISRVIEGQFLRAQEGCPLIPLPEDSLGFDVAPMGSEEVVIYFDLCRHLIEAGWQWLRGKLAGLDDYLKSGCQVPDVTQELKREFNSHLSAAKQEFLSSPYEGGATANHIIRCNRCRVPRSPQIPIEGFEVEQPSSHIVDCDCPICIMMAEGDFGPMFEGLDGYHLELDEEFAFSLFESELQWREESLLGGDDGIDDELESEEGDEEDDDQEHDQEDGHGSTSQTPVDGDDADLDEFSSAWQGIRTSEPLPGDTLGHIKLAFMLAEIISVLQSRKVDPAIVKQLNQAFIGYRQAQDGSVQAAKSVLIERLERQAVRFPQLIPRIADFQSHLDASVQPTRR